MRQTKRPKNYSLILCCNFIRQNCHLFYKKSIFVYTYSRIWLSFLLLCGRISLSVRNHPDSRILQNKTTGYKMKTRTRKMVEGALISALYIVVNYIQEIILPSTSSMPIQVRLAEILCILCVFSSSAIYGVTLGCMIANIINIGVLPLDIVFGTVATLISAIFMYKLRNIRLFSLPILSSLMPVIINGIIISLEFQLFYVADGFYFSSFFLFFGEIAVGEFISCVILGLVFYKLIERLDIFKKNLS